MKIIYCERAIVTLLIVCVIVGTINVCKTIYQHTASSQAIAADGDTWQAQRRSAVFYLYDLDSSKIPEGTNWVGFRFETPVTIP